LWQFWFARGYMSEGRRWLQEALAAGEAAPAPIRAKAFGGAAILAAYLGAYPQAAGFAEQALALCRQLDFKPGITAALNGLVFISGMQGDHERARSLTEEGITLSRSLGDPRTLADVLYYASLTAWLRGDYPDAQSFIEEDLALFQALGDGRGTASCLYGLGLVLVAQASITGLNLYSRSRWWRCAT
jgi:tetratricopeptide (TPR) repeat protein